MQFLSPLRYPGGKGRLSGFMIEVFKESNLCDGIYVEPYAGGAAIALALLLSESAWRIVINDIDHCVYAFWKSTIDETDDFSRMISDTPINIDVWRRQKAVVADPDNHSILELGFACFFLNRTNRSGILNGGVVGGVKQHGKYKLDARFNKKNLLKRIQLIAKYAGRIDVYNIDALDLLKRIAPTLTKKSLIYIDPPYYSKGDQLYTNFYKHQDHAHVAKFIKSIGTPWIVTYDNKPEIKDMYTEEKHFYFQLIYTAHMTRNKGGEVMFYRGINLPMCLNNNSITYIARPSINNPLGIRQ